MAQKPCKIEGEAMKGVSAEKVYVFIEDESGQYGDGPNDSIEVKNGKFAYTSTLNDVREVYFVVKMAGDAQCRICTYLVPGEKGKVSFSDKEYFLSGSKFYKEWDGADRSTAEIDKRMAAVRDSLVQVLESMTPEEQQKNYLEIITPLRKLSEERSEVWKKYFEAHRAEEGCGMFYLSQGNTATSLLENMGDKVKGSRFESYLLKKAEVEAAKKAAQEKAEAEAKAKEEVTGEGKMFTDFEAEYNGKVQKLSDYVGKGKYVLVDFWASWCGPCKAEIPNLIEAYNKYKGDKFEVLGVATWDKPKDTEKAIEQMQIPYPQIMNAQKAGSDAYGIMGIPQIILFAPDGTIYKRNLRGAAIEETLKGIFEK